MGLGLRLSVQHSLRHELTIGQGAGRSIFRQLEELLFSSSDIQKAVSGMIPARRMEQYRDLIDCIFCEIFTQHQSDAFAYYRGEGPLLKEILTMKQRVAMEAFMLRVVAGAFVAWETKQKTSWASLVTQLSDIH